MKKTMLSVLFLSLSAFAGGDEVNNGGGIAEKNVMFAYKSLEKYIDLCLKAPSCKLNEVEINILSAIDISLAEERKAQRQIRFGSERAQPGSFILDGQLKVAKTGSQVGSPIYFNLDLLYSKNRLGQYEAISITDAVAILIHELGHHQNVPEHDVLDLLGAKVALFAQKAILTTPLLPHNEKISMVVINEPSVKAFPTILIYANNDVIDASHAFYEEADCRTANIPLPVNLDVYLPGAKLKGASLHNLYWWDVSERNGYAAFTVRGNLTAYCKDSDTLADGDRDYKMDFTIRLKMDPASKQWKYIPKSLVVDQTRGDAWWKFIRIPIFGLPPAPDMDPNQNQYDPDRSHN